MGVPVIEINDVSKRFVIRKEKSLKERLVNFGRSNLHREDFWALKDVSLTIESGTTIGLVGPNGSGKSTLLKTIGGILQPTSGSVRLRGRLAALLELGAGFHPDLTGRENVYLNAALLGLSRQQTEEYFDAIVEFSGIEPFIDTQVKFYSSGMYVRLAFAVAVHVDPDVLLVDEVLAVGDEPFQRKCMDRIRAFQKEGRTIVLVTHSLETVSDLCDRAVVLEHGQVLADDTPGVALRALRGAFEADRLEQLEKREGAGAGPTARIDGVGLVQNESDVDTVHPGEPLTVRVHMSADEPLEGPWGLMFWIESAMGQQIYQTSSRRLDMDLPRVHGGASFDFDIPSVALGEGAYSIGAAVSDRSGSELHRLPQAATLVVAGDGRELGFLRLSPTMTGKDARYGRDALT